MVYPNYSVFEGYFQKNLQHGKGTLIKQNGFKYTGNYLDGLANGSGQEI